MIRFAPAGRRPLEAAARGSGPHVDVGVFRNESGGQSPGGHPAAGRCGVTLGEVVTLVATVALAGVVLLPALAAGRAESLAARCASNLQRIGRAYALWAGDNTGFWPPRCRENAGCDLFEVPAGFSTRTSIREEDLLYAEHPNDGVSIVGEPTLATGSPAYGQPGAFYNRANDFSLNPYLIPNWRLGQRMPIARCPADIDTLRAPDSSVAGIAEGSVASSFQLHGTSYYTNIERIFPWHGHGAWAHTVENAINPRVGPNYNPELIYKPHRYVVAGDLGPFYWNAQGLGLRSIGAPSGLGAWHDLEPLPAVRPSPENPYSWRNASALFGDLHVRFGDYPIPFTGITLPSLCPFVNENWSLYPYRRRARDIANCP